MSTSLNAPAGSRIGGAAEPSAWQTVRRGLVLSPEFRRGLGVTAFLAVLATAGRIVVPITVQQTVDRGLDAQAASGAIDLDAVRSAVLFGLLAVIATSLAAYGMNVRLFRAAESGLSTLRVKAFRHIHDLSTLTQNEERRGSLVSRVTSDVDAISTFVQWGGLILLISIGQLVVATGLMAYYSWELTLLVWVTFLPFFGFLRVSRRWVAEAYGVVRVRVGDMLSAISESVVGASVVRAYGIQERTAGRIDDAVQGHYDAALKAQRRVAVSFSTGEVAAGFATALVVVVGVVLGVAGRLSAGELLAFLFLVTLFVAPVQAGTEVLNEAQNAVAGWRRVLAVLDTKADIADPAAASGLGTDLPPGPLDVRLEQVEFGYPSGPRVLHGIDVSLAAGSKVAIVGETGSGKTTFAKLLVRLLDPGEGGVRLGGVDLRAVPFASLRRRVLLVPQEGFLFEGTLRHNLGFAAPDASDAEMLDAIERLGLQPWYDGLPAGLDLPVGQRGESLSAGERQLVSLIGAALVDPDLLVLDEATSAVDPATEMRLQTALSTLVRGRTSITIAHRLSTAESADEVLVFDSGRIVERGPHAEVLALGGTYARLHRAWMAQGAQPAIGPAMGAAIVGERT